MTDYCNLTDEQLATIYVEGDNRAFDALLERNQQKLFTYIMFMVGDHSVADDIFQDTFVKAIAALKERRYTNTGKFSFWLMRIAHNEMISWFRSKRNQHTVEPTADNDLQNLRSASVMDSSREGEIINEQVMTDVRRLMEALPTPQREVVYMRFYQDMPFKEIAETTGVSINTSLGRMRYAVMNMRKMARENNIELKLQ